MSKTLRIHSETPNEFIARHFRDDEAEICARLCDELSERTDLDTATATIIAFAIRSRIKARAQSTGA